MTLTEKLYEGTLPTGWYYFNNGLETYIVLYKNINSKYSILPGIEVQGKVPSLKDVRTLARKLLQTNPDLKEWLEKNYGEYL